MVDRKYLTVKEVAEEFNITPQAVYKKLSTDFKPFLKIENGKKRLNIKVLELKKEEIIKPVDNQFNNQFKRIIDVLEEQNENLKNQLEIKDKQIEELNKQLEKSQQIHEHTQILLKQSQDQVLLLEVNSSEQKKNIWERLFKK